MSTPGSTKEREPERTRILGKYGWQTLEEARAALPTGWSWRDWRDWRRWWPGAALVLGLLLFVVLVLQLLGDHRRPDAGPPQQQAFLAAVEDAQREVSEGNELTVVTAGRERARTVCRLLGPRHAVEGWTGTIQSVGTTFGGDGGVLSVSLGQGIEVKTRSLGVFDDEDRTLIRPGSGVYESLAQLHTGDPVTFSGAFVPGDQSCLDETSVRDRNGILTPDFVFRFSAVSRQ